MPKNIAWLSQISRADAPAVGAKAADLGELLKLQMPVPAGFVVTTTAYYAFLQLTGLRPKLEALLDHIDSSDSHRIVEHAASAQTIIRRATMPKELADEIFEAYQHLSAKDTYVAVRASVPDTDAEDIALSRQALLNVLGKKQLEHAVKEIWAGLFSAESIHRRAESGAGQVVSGTAVLVQRMVESQTAGMLFTVDPMAGENITSIEAIWGLGEPMVSGEITPDHYEVDRSTWHIRRKDVARQEWQLVLNDKSEQANSRLAVSAGWQRKQKLSDEHIVALSKLAAKIEEHYGHPQDCEWALGNGELYVVQTRPVTPLPLPASTAAHVTLIDQLVPLVSGVGAAPGIATGAIRIVRSSQDVHKVKPGEILICRSTTPDYNGALEKAAAVVTINGGQSSHAAVVARQLGIPAVVEAGEAVALLKNGEIVTVDGDHGRILSGEIRVPKTALVGPDSPLAPDLQPHTPIPVSTATKVYINISEPHMAEELARKSVDGVGLLRAEFMLSELAEHPNKLIEEGREDAIISVLYEGLMEVAKAFSPRPVMYRACDFSSREFARLVGGEKYEIEESNPLLGFRGAHRYISDPAFFKLEMAALRKARVYYRNLWLMVPFVRTPDELVKVKQLLAEDGLYRSGSFKLYMMVEVPSNIFLLDQFLGVGIDGISLGTNDLTQLILGIDRDSPRVAPLFDERNEAVMMAMEQAVRGALKHGVAASICGQAASVYPEVVQKLVSWGTTSISVSPETAESTRQMVADAEYQLVREARNR